MATFNGTNDDDNFVGTNLSDIFNMNVDVLGVDTIDGAGGSDTLNLDYSSPTFTSGFGSTIASNGAGGFGGTIWTSPGYRTIFSNLEVLNLRLTDGADSIDIDGASLTAGAVLNIDAGDNNFFFDTISLNLSALGDTTFDASAGGTVTTNIAGLTIANFESYAITLGNGTNSFTGAGESDFVFGGTGAETISTGGGSDRIESQGSDVVDGGDGTDIWVGLYGDATADLTFTFDGFSHAGSLTGGTTLTDIEQVELTTGSGDDSVTLTGGAAWFTLDGGEGDDSLTIDDSGTTSLPIVGNPVRITANGTGGFDGTVDGTSKNFHNFEHVAITGTDSANTFVVNAAPLLAGATLDLAGGLGSDTLSINFSAFANTSFTAAAGGVVTTNIAGLQLATFESYVIVLGGGSNIVNTFSGNDQIVAGSGNDTVNAGLGTDTLLYQTASSGVTISLAITAAQATGGSGSDTIAGFENLTGSAFGDHLAGNAGINIITGGAGDDILDGGDGNDIFAAVNGGSAGNDEVHGGTGTDRVIYSGSWLDYDIVANGDGTITVTDLRDGSPDGTDTLFDVETISFLNGGVVPGPILQLADTINTAPVAVDDEANMVESGLNGDGIFFFQGDALSNDQDANLSFPGLGENLRVKGVRTGAVSDGGPLTEVIGEVRLQGTYGELRMVGGIFEYTLDNGRAATEALVSGQSADDIFTYQVIDAHGLTSLAQIVIHVAGDDDPAPPPVTATDDKLLVTKGKASSIDAGALIANDIGLPGELLTVTGIANVTGATVQLIDGRLVIAMSGAAASFDYTVTGGDGVRSDTGHVTLTSVDPKQHDSTVAVPDGFAGADLQEIKHADTLIGNAGFDHLVGDKKADLLIGNGGDDWLVGDKGDDVLNGGDGNDRIDGGDGNDTADYSTATAGVVVNLAVAGPQNTLGSGNDSLSAVENLLGSAFDDVFDGDGNDNILTGGAGQDILRGGGGKDQLFGGLGFDRLEGGAGKDVIDGGANGDILTGGADADSFVFKSLSDFGIGGGLDLITDFSRAEGDKIDLKAIDPDLSRGGDQKFTFIGTAAFTSGPHDGYEVRYQDAGGGDLFVEGDANRDGIGDFGFIVHAANLTANDFVL